MAGFTQTPTSTDPLELLKYFQEQSNKPLKEKEGIGSKPATSSKDSEVMKFFADFWSSSEEKVAKAREELAPDMAELARRSAEEAALFRMEKGITQSLPEGGARKPLPEGTTLRPVSRPITESEDGSDELVKSLVAQLSNTRLSVGKATEESAPVTAESAPVTRMTQGAGLMSPPVQDAVPEVDTTTAEPVVDTTEDDNTFVSSFVDLMGTAEGTTDHTASEGQFTYAYGILPATASGYSLNADDYDNRRDFAEAVYAKMYEDAKTDYEDVFDGLTTDEAKGVLSLYTNLGKLPTGVVDALDGETKDMDAAGDSLASVVHYTHKKTKVKYASKGLSVRRAGEYNTLRNGEEGFEPVTSVSVTGTKAAPVFNWLDASGNTVKSFASSKTLSPDNSMKSQAVE